ncbi:MAG: signal transduction protein [Thiotrichaceae bacterium IS1]|nr:MAG: signal transduction protein [Thiotrichaceae bacterium IS1]
MLVKEIMSRAVKTITPETRLQEVASLMCLNRFSGLPVVGEDNELLGILAERDVLRYLFPDLRDVMEGTASMDFEAMEDEYKKILQVRTGDLMSKNIIAISPEIPILKAVSVMAKHNFRRIPVAEGNKLVGVLSLGDIHRAIFMKNFAGN